jgi:hypothetical protein
MADQSPTAPPDGGGGGLMSQPTWVYLAVGGVALGLFLWWRHRNSATAGSGTTTNGPFVTPSTDPLTGGMIDPTTGEPYLTSQPSSPVPDNSTWLQSAEAAAKNLGYAPALVQQSLYDFLNGNPLNTKESGVINTLLGKVGYPPVLIPFIGTPPSTTPPVAKPPIVKRPKNWPTNWPWPWTPGRPPTLPIPRMPGGGTFPARPVNSPRPHLPGVGQRPTPVGTAPKTAPQLLPTPAAASFIQQVLSGRAPLPSGIKLPTGYHFRPGTRYLVRNRAA